MKIAHYQMPFRGYHTAIRVVGAASKRPPLLLLHGGPGSTHNYFEVLDALAAKSHRQLIMYDQLGCGESSIPDDHPELYNAHTWVQELQAVRQFLHLRQVHLLGQSWGGMLALIYLCDYQPQGIKSLILASSLSSAKLWARELHRLIKYLPATEQAAIAQAEKSQDFSTAAYHKANQHFMNQHMLKMTPQLPEPVRRPKKGGQVAYLTAWGPNEYNPQGNLRDYEYTAKLKKITVPALITSGTDDLCTPYIAKTMKDALPYSCWHLFENCGHLSFVQKTAAYEEVLTNWLNAHD